MSVDHYPVIDIVVPMKCYYGECEHIDEECPGESKRVCGVCVSEINGEPVGAVLWPCEFQPADLGMQMLNAAMGTGSSDSTDPCPEWQCHDLSSEDRREGRTCPEHPCTCSNVQES